VDTKKLLPKDLDPDEAEYYYKAVDTDDHCGGIGTTSNRIYKGEMDLWVYNVEDTILVCTTKMASHDDGYKEMIVCMMAGTNVTDTRAHESIHKSMMEYAVENGCERMIAFVRPEMWEHFRDRTNYKEEYIQLALYPEEIE